jgi:hypothetical protein
MTTDEATVTLAVRKETTRSDGSRPRDLNAPTRPRMLAAAHRLQQVIDLRLQSLTYEEIAAQIPGPSGKPITTRTVQRDLEKAIKKRNAEIATSVDLLRDREVQRLDKLLAVLWPKAMAGHLDYIEALHKNILVRSRLLGLEAPQKHDIDASVRAASVEVRRVVVELPDSGDVLTPEILAAERDEVARLEARREAIASDEKIVDAIEPLS